MSHQPKMNELELLIQEHADSRPLLSVPVKAVLPRAKIEGEFKIRDLVLGEKLAATKGAVGQRKDVLTSLPAQYIGHFLDDPTFLKDVQTVEELFRAIRNGEDPARPAFSSADSMSSLMTEDELATLFAYFEKARAARRDIQQVDNTTAAELAASCVSSPAAAREVLMRIPKYQLVELFCLLATQLVAKEAFIADSEASAADGPA